MATATLFTSIRQRNISSAPLSAFKSLSGAKSSGTIGLSHELGVIARPFSLRHFGTKVIGIDLGTTNSRVAVREGEIAKVIRNSEGSLSVPSVVAFNHKGEYLTVGTPAKHQAVTTPKNTVFRAKRLIGRRFDDFQSQEEKRIVPYNIIKAVNGDAWVEVNGEKYSPSQIAAFVIAKLKKIAEDYIGNTVHECVISVPSFFNDAQREATRDAARIAGLNVHTIIKEPIAATISQVLPNRVSLVAVIDLGGGTFDVSILKIDDTIFRSDCEIIAENGDTALGGVDFDDAIVDILISEFKRSDDVYLTRDIVSLQRLREAAEKAKIELSTESKTNINLPFIITDAYGAKHLNITLERSIFEAQVNHLIERIESLCEKCMEDAGLTSSDPQLDEVILVGGMSHVPIVQQVVTKVFRGTPIKVVNPDEATALGASYYSRNY